MTPVTRRIPPAEPPLITRWVLWASTAALVGAVLGFVGDLYHIYWGFFTDLGRSELLDDPMYLAHGLLIAVGYALALLVLVALALRLRARFRTWGVIGVLVAFVGTALVAGDYWAESVVTPGVVAGQSALADGDATGLHLVFVIFAFALLALGWLFVAIGAWRAGVPRPLAVLLAVAAVIAFTPFSGSNLLLFAAVGVLAVWLRKGPVDATVASEVGGSAA